VSLDLIFPGYQLSLRAGFINPLVCALNDVNRFVMSGRSTIRVTLVRSTTSLPEVTKVAVSFREPLLFKHYF
jgi:hypothetical protein